jgi:hypothetical protein
MEKKKFYDLEEYFDNYNEKLSINFYKRANEFGFNNIELFKSALEYNMLIRGLIFYKEEKERYYQKKFSKKIFERDVKCIVVGKGNHVEFEACHIIAVHEGGDYTESNGLLLTRNIHKLYDDYLWSINPESLCIEAISTNEEIIGSIINYLGKKVNLKPDFFMLINLKSHWAKFLDRKSKFVKKQ